MISRLHLFLSDGTMKMKNCTAEWRMQDEIAEKASVRLAAC